MKKKTVWAKSEQGFTVRPYLTGPGDRGLRIVCAHDPLWLALSLWKPPPRWATWSATARNGRFGATDPAGFEASRKWAGQLLEYCDDLTARGTRAAWQQWHKFHHRTRIEATCNLLTRVASPRSGKEGKMVCLSH